MSCFVHVELEGFISDKHFFVVYEGKTYAVTDPALSHFSMQFLPTDPLREPGTYLVIASERRRSMALPNRLALVR